MVARHRLWHVSRAATLLASAVVTFVTAQPAPQPLTSLVWPLHGSDGANGVGGWASSEVPVGAHLPYGALRLGPDTSVCWEDGDWYVLVRGNAVRSPCARKQ